jgi:hypothetical protein
VPFSDDCHQVGLVDLALWGKSRGLDVPYPVVCHLLDAAAVAGELWDSYVPHALRRTISRTLGVEEPEAGRLVALWAGLHDVGKVTPGCAPHARGGDPVVRLAFSSSSRCSPRTWG